MKEGYCGCLFAVPEMLISDTSNTNPSLNLLLESFEKSHLTVSYKLSSLIYSKGVERNLLNLCQIPAVFASFFLKISRK